MTIDNLLVTPQTQDKRDIISQCCLCKDFVSKTGGYITLAEEHIKEAYTRYLVSHGYCESCMNVMENKVFQHTKTKKVLIDYLNRKQELE